MPIVCNLKNSLFLTKKILSIFLRTSDGNNFLIFGISIVDSTKLTLNEWSLGSDLYRKKCIRGDPYNFGRGHTVWVLKYNLVEFNVLIQKKQEIISI